MTPSQKMVNFSENASAQSYIMLGKVLYQLSYSETIHDVCSTGTSLISYLNTLDFPATRALAGTLGSFVESHRSMDLRELEQKLSEGEREAIRQNVGSMMTSLIHESQGRRLALRRNSGAADQLRAQSSKLSQQYLKLIAEETINCLETSNHRSSIVMGWNLVYEFIRLWIWNDPSRRHEFNKELTSRYKSKSSQYEPLKDYEDFFALGEALVLDVAHESKLLQKRNGKSSHMLLTGGIISHIQIPRKQTLNQRTGISPI